MTSHGLDTPVPWEPEVFVSVSGASGRSHACKLRGLNNGALHVISSEPMDAFTDVAVTFGELTIPGTVLYSRPKNHDHLICIAFSVTPGKSGRRDPRVPVARRCLLTALGDNESVRLEGMITDISYSGIGVRVSWPIKIGTMICIETDDFVAAGQLLHRHRISDNQFSAGIHLTDIIWGETGSVASSGCMKANWLQRLWQTCRTQALPRSSKVRGLH